MTILNCAPDPGAFRGLPNSGAIVELANSISWSSLPNQLTKVEKAKFAIALKSILDKGEAKEAAEARDNRYKALSSLIEVLKSAGVAAITMADFEDLVTITKISDLWKRNPKACDAYGLRRSLGDHLGQSGFKLETTEIDGMKHYVL